MAAHIQLLPVNDQRDRLDVAYYDRKFIRAEHQLRQCPYPLIPLSQVMNGEGRYGILPPSSEYCEEGIRLVRSSDLSPRGVAYSDTVIVPAKYSESDRARIRKGDVLIGVKGACAFFDIYAVQEEPPPSIVNGSIFRFQCLPAFNPRFIALWLLSEQLQAIVFRERSNLGISYISLDVLKAIVVPNVPLDLQQRIVERFDCVLHCAEKVSGALERVQKDWDRLLEKTDRAFAKYLGIEPPPEDHTKVKILRVNQQNDRLDWGIYDPSRIATEERLTIGFRNWLRLKDIAVIHREKVTPGSYPEREFRLVRVKWHAKGAELREIKTGDEISGALTQVRGRDVVISRIDSTQRAVAVISTELDGAYVSNEFYAIRVAPDKYLPELLSRILATRRYVAYFFAQKTGSTKRLRLSEEVLKELPLPRASLQQQMKILGGLTDLESEANELTHRESEIMERQRQMVAKARENIFDLLNDDVFARIIDDAELVAETPGLAGVTR